MTTMTGKHWALIAAFLGVAAAQIMGLSTWAEATKPVFAGSIMAQLAILIGGIYSDKPEKS